MNDQFLKAIQQSRDGERAHEVPSTKLADLFPNGVWLPSLNTEPPAGYGKGIEECIETQRAFNLMMDHLRKY